MYSMQGSLRYEFYDSHCETALPYLAVPNLLFELAECECTEHISRIIAHILANEHSELRPCMHSTNCSVPHNLRFGRAKSRFAATKSDTFGSYLQFKPLFIQINSLVIEIWCMLCSRMYYMYMQQYLLCSTRLNSGKMHERFVDRNIDILGTRAGNMLSIPVSCAQRCLSVRFSATKSAVLQIWHCWIWHWAWLHAYKA